jgi:hypothetical protein
LAKSPDDRAPVPAGKGTPAETSSRAEIDAFLERVRTIERAQPASPRGRLIFALDATMSRQPTWDTACKLQGEMFLEAQAIGGLDNRGQGQIRSSLQISTVWRILAPLQPIRILRRKVASLLALI